MEYLHHTSFGIGVLGVLVIVFGVASGLARFLRSEFLAMRGAYAAARRPYLHYAIAISDVAAEVTRRISSSREFRLLTSAATFAPNRSSK